MLPGLRIVHLSLLLSVCCLLAASCSTPTVPDMGQDPERYIDELQWFELFELEVTGGDAGQDDWIAAALSEQLSGQRLYLPFEGEQIVAGVADIQLEYDNLPLASAWNSPPGELSFSAGSARLEHVINFTMEPALPVNQRITEQTSLSGSFQPAAAQSVLRQARELRSRQPLKQTNPEANELWLLGHSVSPLTVTWQIEGMLGGQPFSFSASQQLIAVSSYYELTILQQSGQDEVELSRRHLSLLAGGG